MQCISYGSKQFLTAASLVPSKEHTASSTAPKNKTVKCGFLNISFLSSELCWFTLTAIWWLWWPKRIHTLTVWVSGCLISCSRRLQPLLLLSLCVDENSEFNWIYLISQDFSAYCLELSSDKMIIVDDSNINLETYSLRVVFDLLGSICFSINVNEPNHQCSDI